MTEGDLFMKSKKQVFCEPRHLLYYVCSKRNMRLVDIQRYLKDFGYESLHSPIKNGIEKAEKKIKKDKDVKAVYNRVKNAI